MPAASARYLQSSGNPNRAAAGRDYPLQYAQGFVRDVNTVDRNALLNLGINTFATIYGVLEMYGFQTAVAQSETTPFWQANCSRTRMWIKAQALAIGENFLFRPIDGRGLLALALKAALDEPLLRLYSINGLYGDRPGTAFNVIVGSVINTTNTIAQGELHAAVEARLSLHAKAVIIDLFSVPVAGNVSAAA